LSLRVMSNAESVASVGHTDVSTGEIGASVVRHK